MKHVFIFSCLLTSVACLFSCKKDNDPEPPPSTFMKATINGKPWEATSVGVIGMNNITKGALGKTDSSTIVLCLPDTVSATYNFRVNESNALTLTKFDAGKYESDYLITWSTGDEIDMKQFVIEYDGNINNSTPMSWYSEDTIPSQGPGSHNYQYHVKMTGWYYFNLFFRLKMIDKNNLATYSQVRVVNNGFNGFYAAPGQEARHGYNGTITITGKEGHYITGTFSFTVKSLKGDVIKIENGQFKSYY